MNNNRYILVGDYEGFRLDDIFRRGFVRLGDGTTRAIIDRVSSLRVIHTILRMQEELPSTAHVYDTRLKKWTMSVDCSKLTPLPL